MADKTKPLDIGRCVAGLPKPEGVLPHILPDIQTLMAASAQEESNMNNTNNTLDTGRCVAGSPKPEGVLPNSMPAVNQKINQAKMESQDHISSTGRCVAGTSDEDPKPEGVLPTKSGLEAFLEERKRAKAARKKIKRQEKSQIKKAANDLVESVHELKLVGQGAAISAWGCATTSAAKPFDPIRLSLIHIGWMPMGAVGVLDNQCECKKQGLIFADVAVHSTRCGFLNYIRDGKVGQFSIEGIVHQFPDWRPLFKKTKYCTCHQDFLIFESMGVLRWERVRYLARDVVALYVANDARVWLSTRCRMPERLRQFVVAPGGEEEAVVEKLRCDWEKSKSGLSFDSYVREARSWPWKGSGLVPKGSTLRQRRIHHHVDCLIAKETRDEVVKMMRSQAEAANSSTIHVDEIFNAPNILNVPGSKFYIDPWGRKKLGSHSVGGEGFEIISYTGSFAFGPSTVWNWLYDLVTCRTETWKYNDFSIVVRGQATMNAVDQSTILCVDEIEQQLWTEVALRPFKVVTLFGETLETLDVAALEAFEVGGHIDFVKLARTAPMECPLSKDVLANVVGAIEWSLGRVDNTMLYAKGFLIALQLAEMERTEIWSPDYIPMAGAFLYRNVYQDAAQAREMAENIKADLDAGAFIFDSATTTNEDAVCLQLLAQPLPVLRHEGITQVSSCVMMDSWPIRIYGRGPRDMPAPAWPSAFKMYTFMLEIAKLRDEVGDAVAGAAKAATLANLQLTPDPEPEIVDGAPVPLPRRCVYNYTYGIGGCRGRRPRDWNWLWRSLRIGSWPKAGNYDEGDYQYLQRLNVAQFAVASTLLNAGLLLSCSTLLEKLQIDGYDLSATYAQANQEDINYPLLDKLFWADSPTKAALICHHVCLTFRMIFRNSVPTGMWQVDEWCGGKGTVDKRIAGTVWRRIWDWHIPYRFTPLSMANLLISWVDVWGIIGHNATVNLREEILEGTQANKIGWDAYIGEPTYSNTFDSDTPYNYIAYSAMVMNVLLQQRRRGAVWNILWRLWQRSTVRKLTTDTKVDKYKPLKYNDFPLLRPGTVRSWMRRLNVGLSPLILATDFGPIEWAWIKALQGGPLLNAGLLLPGSKVDVPRGMSILSGLALLGIHENSEFLTSRYRSRPLEPQRLAIREDGTSEADKENVAPIQPPGN